MSLKSFTEAYLVCALWTATDDKGEPIQHAIIDIHPDTRANLDKDCIAFYEAYASLWEDEMRYGDPEAGHDFWLTRNGHGAGFWDRGIKNGKLLTESCRAYKGIDLYVGDDDKVHT